MMVRAVIDKKTTVICLHANGMIEEADDAMRTAVQADAYSKAAYTSLDDFDLNALGELSKQDTWTRDNALAAIWKQQGFDGRPTVLSAEEFDVLVAEGKGVHLWRGVDAATAQMAGDYAEAYRSGEAFPGIGTMGNGSYFTTLRAKAVSYADEDVAGLIEVVLRPDARMISYDDIRTVYDKYVGDYEDSKTERLLALMQAGNVDGAIALNDSLKGRSRVINDYGRLASMLGYDGIDAGSVTVILNRTAVVARAAT